MIGAATALASSAGLAALSIRVSRAPSIARISSSVLRLSRCALRINTQVSTSPISATGIAIMPPATSHHSRGLRWFCGGEHGQCDHGDKLAGAARAAESGPGTRCRAAVLKLSWDARSRFPQRAGRFTAPVLTSPRRVHANMPRCIHLSSPSRASFCRGLVDKWLSTGKTNKRLHRRQTSRRRCDDQWRPGTQTPSRTRFASSNQAAVVRAGGSYYAAAEQPGRVRTGLWGERRAVGRGPHGHDR